MTYSASDIAAKIGGAVEGDATVQISRLASLSEAKSGDLSFLSNKKYADQMASTQASAVIVPEDWTGPCGAQTLIRVNNPDRAFAVAAPLVAPPPPERWPGIHYSAVVSPEALIGKNVYIGPLCVIEDGAKIGDDALIERFRQFWTRRVREAGTAAVRGIRIECELRDYDHAAAHVDERTVRLAVLILEDAQGADAVGHLVRRFLRIGVGDAQEHKIALTDFGHPFAADLDRCLQHPLNPGFHTSASFRPDALCRSRLSSSAVQPVTTSA